MQKAGDISMGERGERKGEEVNRKVLKKRPGDSPCEKWKGMGRMRRKQEYQYERWKTKVKKKRMGRMRRGKETVCKM